MDTSVENYGNLSDLRSKICSLLDKLPLPTWLDAVINHTEGLELDDEEKIPLLNRCLDQMSFFITLNFQFLGEFIKMSDSEQRDALRNYSFSEEQKSRITRMFYVEARSIQRNRESKLLRQKIYFNLSEILNEHDMTLRQLSIRLSENPTLRTSPSQFSKMFSPNNSVIQEPSLQILCAIADYFNVTLDRLINGNKKVQDSKKTISFDNLTYNKFILLLNRLEEKNIISFERNETRQLNASGDVDVTIHIQPNIDGSGGDDGTIAHYLSMYTALKEHFPDTPEGRRMVGEMNEMMLKSISDSPLFSD